MASRFSSRLRAFLRATLSSRSQRAPARPSHPARILVLHELLLGDTLMLAPLLARLRAGHPEATIYVTTSQAALPLFAGAPYDVHALPFSERDDEALVALAPARDCDLALIPGDNRYALTARALGARWIVALADRRRRKNRFVDEQIAWPQAPTDLGEIFASLAGADHGERYRRGDWPAPAARRFEAPAAPYALLHVGASTPLKHWPAARWAQLAAALEHEGMRVAFSAGPGEGAVIERIDPDQRYRRYAGSLDLAQLWSLVQNASLFVTLDTGVAHIAKLTATPTVCLYGPSSAQLVGRGRFFVDAPFVELTVDDFHCRDQRLLFKREIAWVRRCGRSLAECARPACMEAIDVDRVLDAARRVRAQAEQTCGGSTRG